MDLQQDGSKLRMARLCGAIAVGFGLLALAGWALERPFLATFGEGRIPMAPSTAALFVLYGIAVVLRARLPLGSKARGLGSALVAAGGSIAALLLVLSFLGIHPAAELLGFGVPGVPGIPGPPGKAPLGHISPVVAVCFLLASLAFLGSLPSAASSRSAGPGARPGAAAPLAPLIAGLVLATSGLLVLAYLIDNPFFYGGSFIPPAATTSVAMAALGVALLALSGRSAGAPASTAAEPRKGIPRALVVIFVLLAAGIVAAGGLYSRADNKRRRAAVEQQLAAAVELKASELAQWRAARLGDASVLLGNPVLAALVLHLLDDSPDAEATEQLRTWLTKVQTNYLYDQVSLLDSQGNERLVVPAGRGPVAPAIARRVPEILRTARVTFEDFYRDERDGRIYLSLLVPIRDGRGRALGLVVLTIDPEHYLFPFLERWPTPAQSAETLLIRQDGNDELFPDELEAGPHKTPIRRVPLANPDVIAVQTALGQEGIVEGLDDRGVQVLAAFRPIPDSPWTLIARIDAAEANAPLRERLWEMIVLIGTLLATTVAGVGVVWREIRVRDLRGRFEADRESAWLHDVVARSLNEVYVFDPETWKFRFVNRGACENLGYTPEELADLTPLDLKLELTAESFRALLAPLRSPGRPKLAFEGQHRRKDGTSYPVEVHLQLVDSGGKEAFLALVNDITERKRAEASLGASERRYQALFDRSLAGVYRTTLDGRILECNDAFARIFGFASREDALSGHADSSYPTPADRTDFLAGLQTTGLIVNREVEGRRLDGSTVWLLENAHLVDGGESAVSAVIEGTLLDITERKNLETELRQSQKIEAIGRLAGGVAHDFNNILGVILGYGELVRSEVESGTPVFEYVTEMVQAAERAATLTRQLQAFSRKQILQPRRLDLNELVGNAHRMLDRVIGEDIALVVRPAPKLGTVLADPGQIDQILLNLAINARDAMPRGGTLTIETVECDLREEVRTADRPAIVPGRYVMIAVSDTGVGMDAETQRRIFEPFFTTKPPGQGTGLGLSTVYGIVKQSGGYIWVYSEPGIGTTFKIYLPQVDELPDGYRPGVPLTMTPGGHETILLVEDSPTLRDLTRRQLEGAGYTVLLAGDGEEALMLAEARAGAIDLLLTDVVMPKVGGGELARRLAASRPDLPVLFMSGYTGGAISQHGILADDVALLEKPFSGEKLVQAVRAALDRPDAGAPPPENEPRG